MHAVNHANYATWAEDLIFRASRDAVVQTLTLEHLAELRWGNAVSLRLWDVSASAAASRPRASAVFIFEAVRVSDGVTAARALLSTDLPADCPAKL